MDKIIVKNTETLHGIYEENGKRNIVHGKDLEQLIMVINKKASRIKKIYDKNGNIEFVYKDILFVLDNKKNFMNDDRFLNIIDKYKKRQYKLLKIKVTATTIGLGALGIAAMISSQDAQVKSYSTDSLDTTTSSYSQYDDSIEKGIINHNDEEYVLEENTTNNENNIEETTTTEKTYDNYMSDEEIRDYLGIPKEYEVSKLEKTKDNYYDLICKYSNMYGLDPDLMCAIATQESGIHSNKLSRYGNGLFQIEGVHIGETLHPYNYETESEDTVVINENTIVDLEHNIQIGCAIYQDCLMKMNGNEIAALKAYNLGLGAMNNMINNYCDNTNMTKEEVLNNKLDTGWNNYHSSSYGGDTNYISNVLRYYTGDLSKMIYNNITKTL